MQPEDSSMNSLTGKGTFLSSASAFVIINDALGVAPPGQLPQVTKGGHRSQVSASLVVCSVIGSSPQLSSAQHGTTVSSRIKKDKARAVGFTGPKVGV